MTWCGLRHTRTIPSALPNWHRAHLAKARLSRRVSGPIDRVTSPREALFCGQSLFKSNVDAVLTNTFVIRPTLISAVISRNVAYLLAPTTMETPRRCSRSLSEGHRPLHCPRWEFMPEIRYSQHSLDTGFRNNEFPDDFRNWMSRASYLQLPFRIQIPIVMP